LCFCFAGAISDIDEGDVAPPSQSDGKDDSTQADDEPEDFPDDSVASVENSSVADTLDGDSDAEFTPLPMPLLAPPAKSVLKKIADVDEGSEPKKKYKAHKRVIRFVVGEDKVVEGGIEEGDTVVSLSSYEEALAVKTPPEDKPVETATESGGTSDETSEVASTPKEHAMPHAVAEVSAVSEEQNQLQATRVPSAEQNEEVSALVPLKPDMKLNNGIKGLLTKEQEQLAITSLAHGVIKEEAKDFTMKIHKNPVRVKGRTVHMFNREERDESDSSEEEAADEKKGDNWALVSKASDALVLASHKGGGESGQIWLSGWLFSGVYSLELSLKPVDTLKMSITPWVECVQYVEDAMKNSWLSQLIIESLVSTQDWAINASKCRACALGIVRQKERAQLEDEALRGLCMCCMARKTLYDRVVRAQPRSSRKRFMMEWPFHAERTTESDRLIPGPIETTFVMSKDYEEDPAEVLRRQMEAAQQQKPKIFIKRGDSFNLQSILRKRELDAKKARGDDDSSVYSDSTMLSSVSMPTLSTETSNIRDDISLHGPREISLIPVLLSNKDFDEVERILRVCICRPEYGGDQGVLFVAKLMQMQAEMYKMQGLEVLALGLYLDAADMVVSRLGFDSKESIHAFGAVESLFGRMGMESAVTSFSDSLTRRLKKHFTSGRKVDLLSAYLDDRR
jgi:hypothetical protein